MTKGLFSQLLGATAGLALLAAPLASAEARHHHAKAEKAEKAEKSGKHGKKSHEKPVAKLSKKEARRLAREEAAEKRHGKHGAKVAARAPAKASAKPVAKLAASKLVAVKPKSLETDFDTFFEATQKVAAAEKVAAMQPASGAVVQKFSPRPVSASMPTIVPLVSLPKPRTVYASPFEASIASLADGSQGRIGVAALDLKTGRSVNVLGDLPFPMASTSKVAIVATYLAGVDAGRFTLDQRFPLMLPVGSRRFDGEAAVRPGASYAALDLIEMAITRSDNHATDALLAAVGGPSVVTRWVQQTAGISEFRLDRTIATLVRDDGAVNPATMVDRRDSVTPLAMVRLLAGLREGKWLSASSRDVLMGAMSRTVTGRHRIKALLPEGTQVAHKTGTLSNTSSDIGFIRTADGRELALAIYVTGQGGKAGRDARIASLARAIYDGYETDSSGDRRTVLR